MVPSVHSGHFVTLVPNYDPPLGLIWTIFGQIQPQTSGALLMTVHYPFWIVQCLTRLLVHSLYLSKSLSNLVLVLSEVFFFFHVHCPVQSYIMPMIHYRQQAHTHVPACTHTHQHTHTTHTHSKSSRTIRVSPYRLIWSRRKYSESRQQSSMKHKWHFTNGTKPQGVKMQSPTLSLRYGLSVCLWDCQVWHKSNHIDYCTPIQR